MAVNVAVDARHLFHERGIGRYLTGVLRPLLRRDDLAITLLLPVWFPVRLRARVRAALGSAPALRRTPPPQAHVLWHPHNARWIASPLPSVVTLHDAAPFAYPNPDEAKRRAEQEPFRRSASGADIILVNSAFTRDELVRRLDVAPERCRITPLGVDDAFRAESATTPPLERPYILYVGGIEPLKNFGTLAAAHRAAFPAGDVALVCAGTPPPPDVRAVRLGWLGARELARWYRHALALAMPSLYEGFGLPAVEAMSCGCPVVSAARASLHEICDDAVEVVADGTDVAAWSAALRALRENDEQRGRLRERGRAWAQRFTWDACAERTAAALREAAALGARSSR